MLINSTTAVRGADGQTGPPGDEERGPSGPRVRPGVPAGPNRLPAGVRPHLTVIVPTRNEDKNGARLLERLGPAVEPLGAEIVFVDDSDDGTPEALAVSAPGCPVPVRLLRRSRRARRGGLGSAVVTGARHARGTWVLVMDGDLQHPPESAARLAAAAMRHGSDIVVATRYAGHGTGADGLDGAARVRASSWATRRAQSTFPRRLPMVGAPLRARSAFPAAAVDTERLNPVGFKILLEILVRHPRPAAAEVAYSFAPREAGESKASWHQGLTLL